MPADKLCTHVLKHLGESEAARLLCEMMGWKEPEKITVDAGPNTLDAIRERAANGWHNPSGWRRGWRWP